ncbi:hypothetical protein MUN81_12475 [Hymenobacter sp. 5317J-9]|nr:hypothetical protein [Hymenobacter sp. 5317J-9]UOQ96073.1 hypothetical protein MUN81_12475 [Hymenobacter sp. 5317J-9]
MLCLLLSFGAFSGSAFTYSVRLGVFLLLTFGGACFLEKVYQPWVRKAIG